ncbi:MAG: filamentous hemagglutinin N-terminal domain-containing protein, partial [Cyanobacteria bacterium J06614_10]
MPTSRPHAEKSESRNFSTKVAWALLPLTSGLTSSILFPAADASAQVVSNNDDVNTTVDLVGDQFDITGGQYSADDANLFHSFEQFDLATEQTANFITVPAVQNVIGRIQNGQASHIEGALQVSGSNADLYLMNPAGILLGPDAQLNLSGGFTATSATGIEFEQGQFSANGQAGNYAQMTGPPSTFRFDTAEPGAIVNLADLAVETGESITLLGGTTVNTGNLSAPEGSITVAAVEGESLVRIHQGDQLLSLEVEHSTSPSGSTLLNPQSIGEMLTGGELAHATTLVPQADGSVRLSGASESISEAGGSAIATGSLSTQGNTSGNINVLGQQVELFNADLNASGDRGGGFIRVGGDYQGQGPVFNARQTDVDAASTLSVNALIEGDGGRAIAWADDRMRFYGNIEGRGGSVGGNGGFAEVSGEQHLIFAGLVDLSAEQGELGELLLDPDNVFITDGGPSYSSGGDDYISSTSLESQTANITLSARNDIVLQDLSSNQLTLQPGVSLSLIADSNNISGGEFRMLDPNDTIRAERGDIIIQGAGIYLGTLDTSTDDRDTGGVAGGDVILNSQQGVSAVAILTQGDRTAGSFDSANGGDVTIDALNGDIDIAEAIRTYSYVAGRESGDAGDITLTAHQGDIKVSTTTPTTNHVLRASSSTETYDTGDGGNITLKAPNGIIDIGGGITTSSYAQDDHSSGSSNAGNGGNIVLNAFGDITTGDLRATSEAQTTSFGSGGNGARNGGYIEILSTNGEVDIGHINSFSSAMGDIAQNGGDISIRANDVSVLSIDAFSNANSNAGRGGSVTIQAEDSVTINAQINSFSHARTGSTSKAGGDIEIVGNQIATQTLATWSSTGDDDSDRAGNVSLRENSEAAGNFILVDGDIQAFSYAQDDDSGKGGNVFLETGGSLSITGDVDTYSESGDDDAGDGGEIKLLANMLEVANLDSGSRSPDEEDGASAGLISLHGDSQISVGSILATSTDESDAAIYLVGDQIDLTGGANSVAGDIVHFWPFSNSQDINLGIEDATTGLNISETDIAAIGPSTRRINVGRTGSTGAIAIGQSIIDTVGSRPVIKIVDASTLIGPSPSNPTTETVFQLNSTGTGLLQNASLRFSGVENIVGGSGNDIFQLGPGFKETDFNSISGGDGFNTISYESFVGDALTVSLDNLGISDVQNIVGPSSGGTLIGSNSSNLWTLDDINGNSVNGLAFVNFDTLTGGTGADTFNLENFGTGTGIELRGGNDADNRIITNSAESQWLLDGADTGDIVHGGSRLAAFSEIQHLENTSTTAGDTTVSFERYYAQITGSLSSGQTDLTLIGNDISFGNTNGAGDNQGALISGNGQLTIRPADNTVNIELGGVDSGGVDLLNITEGELAALQAGFSEITIGGDTHTGEISLSSDVTFSDAVVLRSQGNITTAGYDFNNTNGGITLETEGTLETGTLNSQTGGVTLSAQQDIVVEAVRAGGGTGISLSSTTGNVSVADSLDTTTVGIGQDINIDAQADITVGGQITTVGGDRSGNVTLTSTNGSITASGISTAAGSSSDNVGNVSLMSPGSIQIEFIDASDTDSTASNNPLIRIETDNSFTATGTASPGSATITTAGAVGGRIEILYGTEGESSENFSLTQPGGITTTEDTVEAGSTSANIIKNSIILTNRGTQPPAPEPPSDPETPPAAPNVSEVILDSDTGDPLIVVTDDQDELFAVLETAIGGEFSQYLEIDQKPVATLDVAQQTLREVEETTGVNPALLYIYFVPDAGSEYAVSAGVDRPTRPDDQLEVMLITQSGRPIRQRRWGITRDQVEAVGQTLRTQTTRQFS